MILCQPPNLVICYFLHAEQAGNLTPRSFSFGGLEGKNHSQPRRAAGAPRLSPRHGHAVSPEHGKRSAEKKVLGKIKCLLVVIIIIIITTPCNSRAL